MYFSINIINSKINDYINLKSDQVNYTFKNYCNKSLMLFSIKNFWFSERIMRGTW